MKFIDNLSQKDVKDASTKALKELNKTKGSLQKATEAMCELKGVRWLFDAPSELWIRALIIANLPRLALPRHRLC